LNQTSLEGECQEAGHSRRRRRARWPRDTAVRQSTAQPERAEKAGARPRIRRRLPGKPIDEAEGFAIAEQLGKPHIYAPGAGAASLKFEIQAALY